jgi:hypothetical protein
MIRHRMISGAVTGLALATAITTTATAEPRPNGPKCGPRAAIVEQLSKKHQEQQKGIGIISDTAAMELYVSRKGSWTILVTSAQGVSCPIAWGQSLSLTARLFAPEA